MKAVAARLASTLIFPALLASCGDSLPEDEITPVHVTIISHNEDDARYDGYDTKEGYLAYRRTILKRKELIVKYNAKWDFQTDWRFLVAAKEFEKGDVLDSTDGKNIIAYLAGFENISVQAHSHNGTTYRDPDGNPLPEEERHNYADVAYLIESFGVDVPPVIGGALYFPFDNPNLWTMFRNPLEGNLYADYTWAPHILWGAGTPSHQGEEETASGLWQPRDEENFFTHDSSKNLFYIGGGVPIAYYTEGALTPVKRLVDDIESGEAPAGKFYSATPVVIDLAPIPSPSNSDSSVELARFEELLQSLDGLAREGKIVWAHLDEMLSIWKTEYNSEANIYDFCDLHSESTCENHLRGPLQEPSEVDPCDFNGDGIVTELERNRCQG